MKTESAVVVKWELSQVDPTDHPYYFTLPKAILTSVCGNLSGILF